MLHPISNLEGYGVQTQDSRVWRVSEGTGKWVINDDITIVVVEIRGVGMARLIKIVRSVMMVLVMMGQINVILRVKI